MKNLFKGLELLKLKTKSEELHPKEFQDRNWMFYFGKNIENWYFYGFHNTDH